MLARKQSLRRGELILADYGPEETFNESADIEWAYKPWVKRFLRFCALLSLISVCSNTPHTYQMHYLVMYITFAVDAMVTICFTGEMMAKIHTRGWFSGESPYFKDKWYQFDALMVLIHWMSVILHVSNLQFNINTRLIMLLCQNNNKLNKNNPFKRGKIFTSLDRKFILLNGH